MGDRWGAERPPAEAYSRVTRDLPLGVVVVPYTHPDVDRLVADLQQEYVVRYGGVDTTPIHPEELMLPEGLFLLAYDGDQAMAMGGWRVHVEARSGRVPGERAAEIKRMYVVDAARGVASPGWC